MKKYNIFIKLKKKIPLIPLYYIVLPILTLILFLIPILFWFNNSYYVGGDDTLLYYIYPREMINSYLFNIATDNVLSGIGSYSVQFYQLPFFLLITIVKFLFPFLNTQTLMYGLNLSMGFLFFYLFLGLFIKNKSSYDFFIKILGGLLYIFSIFSYYTLWQSLFTPYLVSGFPILLYLFFNGIKKKNITLIILCSLILSLMSILFLLTPWLLLAILSILPMLIILFLENKKYFISYSIIFIGLTILLNTYWLYSFFFSFLNGLSSNNNAISSITSSSFINSAKDTIIAVTRENNLIYPLFNLFHKQIQVNGNWQNYPIFQNWHEKFIYVNFLFAIIILFAGLMLKKTKKEFKKLYLSSTLGWLIILYMFTVNIGSSFGLNFFVWLIENIPGFTMFRNVYGKIAPAYPFIYALMVVVSLKIILDKPLSTAWKKIILIFCFIIVVSNAKPFILNEYFNRPLWTTKNTFTTISGFNNDFDNLVKYLNKADGSSRYFWLPITTVNYVTIKDKNLENHYYTGLSPLQFLANKNDIAGIMSFPLETQKIFTESFINKDYNEVGNILKNLNVNYLIVNNDFSNELQKSYFFASGIPNLYSAQNSEFKDSILGNKIISFNNRYEIYKIKDKYQSNKISLSDSKHTTNSDKTRVEFTKKTNYLYQININNLSGEANLIFLERYSPFWTLYLKNSKETLPTFNHSQTYNYANQWKIDSNEVKKVVDKNSYKLNLDGSINLTFYLYFKPQTYVAPSIIISLLTLFLIILYFIFKSAKFLNKKTLKDIKFKQIP